MNPLAIVTDQDLLCTRCDTRNTGDALYCVSCGARLQTLNAAPLHPAAEHNVRCAACGNANPSGAVYCVTCGASLDSRFAPSYTPASAGTGGMVVQHVYVAAPPSPEELPIGIRAIWFLFVGLWAGQVWLLLAWLLNLTLIGLPLGLWMLNRTPRVMTLSRQRRGMRVTTRQAGVPFIARAAYFLLIGWWFSLLWAELAWLASALIIGLPLAFLMFERVGTVATLGDIME